MHWLTEPSTSVTEETRVSVLACKDLKEIEGVRNCGSHIGQAYLADEVYGVYFGENWISVSPEVDYDKTLDEVHRVVESYPGLYRDVQTYLRERIKEVLTGAASPSWCAFTGPTSRSCRSRPRPSSSGSATSRGSRTRMPRCRPTCRISRLKPIWPKLERSG